MNAKGLNQLQFEAVTHTQGHILVVAGPGTGKTTVIAHRIGFLLSHGYRPEEIAAITFTKRASREMSERLQEMGIEDPPFVGTIHSLGKYILESEGMDFHILQHSEAINLFKEVCHEHNPAETYELISRMRNSLQPLEGSMKTYYDNYIRLLRDKNLVDFDMLLEVPLQLMQRPEGCYLQHVLKEVIIDEFQDTTALQCQFIKALACKNARVFAVGDDDQAIYSFRGASPESLFNFQKWFSGTKTVLLQENYRNPPEIMGVADEVIRQNRTRIQKTLKTTKPRCKDVLLVTLADEYHEAEFIAEEIKKRLGGTGYHDLPEGASHRTMRDFAILVRSGILIPPVEKALKKAGIPYKVHRTETPADNPAVETLLQYLHFLIHNQSDTLKKIINIPRRGIGEKTLNKLLSKSSLTGKDLYSTIKQTPELREFVQTTERLRGSINDIYEMLKAVLQEYALEEYFARESDLIDWLLNTAFAFRGLPLEEALKRLTEEVMLSGADDLFDPGVEGVQILSMHSSKGLQFPVVFILAVEDGIIPYRLAGKSTDPEEERRLLYVAMTRAETELIMTATLQRMLFGRRTSQRISPFVEGNSGIIRRQIKKPVRQKQQAALF